MAFSSWFSRWKRKAAPAAEVVEQPGEDASGNVQLDCATHGAGAATFVCRHLMELPEQRWFCATPTEAQPWPDAWCGACEEAFRKEGEWNQNNEPVSDVVVICSQCYVEGHAASVDTLSDDALDRWHAYVDECVATAQESQRTLQEQFQLDRYERWDVQQVTGQLVFSDQGTPKVVAQIEFIGTVSSASQTWRWAWANFSILESVREAVCVVRDAGLEQGHPKLFVPQWSAEEADGWEMAAIAVHLLGARGVYRAPTANGFSFLAIMDMHWVS